MRKRVEKSSAILHGVTWWLSRTASRAVSWSNYIAFDVFSCCFMFVKSSIVYAFTLCIFVRFETIIWPSIKFKTSWDIFWRRLEWKRFEEYLVILFRPIGCKKTPWPLFLPRSVHLEKQQTAKICKVLFMAQDFQGHFTFNTCLRE